MKRDFKNIRYMFGLVIVLLVGLSWPNHIAVVEAGLAPAELAEPDERLVAPFFVTGATVPIQNGVGITVTSPVNASFNLAVNPLTVNGGSFIVRSHQTAVYNGAYGAAGNMAQLTPAMNFKPGENVVVSLPTFNGIQSSGGDALIPYYQWEFFTTVTRGSGLFDDSLQALGTAAGRAVEMGDLDNDGDLDAFIVNGNGGTVWFNDGAGNFTDSGQALGGGAFTAGVALGDLDRDGDLDAYMTNFTGAGAAADLIWLNNGLGFFVLGSTVAGSVDVAHVNLADFDGDGDLDAFASGLGNSSNDPGWADQLMLNQGGIQGGTEGTFVVSGVSGLGGLVRNTWGTAVGDVDGDGDMDVFIPTYPTSLADEPHRLWINNGNATFTLGWNSGGFTAKGIDAEFGDFDGDGDLDVATSILTGLNGIWKNDGTGNFGAAPFSTFGNATEQTRALKVGDLDNDGDLDIWNASGATSAGEPNSIYLNDGFGNFTLSSQGVTLGNGISYDVDLGDVDGDGDLDAYVANSGPSPIDRLWINRNLGPTIALNPTSLSNTQSTDTIIGSSFDVNNPGSAPLTWNLVEDANGCFVAGGGAGMTWLTNLTPTSGAVAPAGTNTVNFDYDSTGLPPGPYNGYICISSNDTANPVVELPVSLTVTPPSPMIVVSPPALTSTQATNTTNVELLNVANVGPAITTLNWNIFEDVSGKAAVPTACTIYNGAGGPISGSGPGINSFNIAGIPAGTISDVNLYNIIGTYPRTRSELSFQLVSGASTFITLAAENGGCANIADFDFGMDDASATAMGCNINTGGTIYQPPTNPLSGFNGEDAAGTWTLNIIDSTNPRNGNLTGWDLEICTVPVAVACDAVDDIPWVTSIVPASGANAGATSTNVNVTFDSTGLGTGTYTANLCVNSDDPTTPLVTVPVTLDVIVPTTPIISVNPTVLSSSQLSNTVVADSFDISNVGSLDLNWSLVEDPDGCSVGAPPSNISWLTNVVPTSGTVIPAGSDTVNFDFDSTGMSPGVYPGYICISSDDPANPEVSVALTLTVLAPGVTFQVTSFDPKGPAVVNTTLITTTFSSNPNPATVNSNNYWVRGNQTAIYNGGYTTTGNQIVFDSATDFKPGERIMIMLNPGLENGTGSPLDPHFGWEFRAAALYGSGLFDDSLQNLASNTSRSVELGDLDNDGDLDAFVANLTGTGSRVWVNQGYAQGGTEGVFLDSGQSIGTPGLSFGAAIGDLDGDGDLDAYLTNYSGTGSATDEIWKNNGAGGFSLFSTVATLDTLYVSLADFDGDGDLDAVVTNNTGNSPDAGLADQILFNDGVGNFSVVQTLGTVYNSWGSDVGDVDGDGDIDIIVSSWASFNVGQPNTLWLNDGTGTFVNSGQLIGSEITTNARFGDVDGDNDLDIVFSNQAAVNEVWSNDGAGTFTLLSTFGNNTENTRSLALGDFDADGDLDVMAVSALPASANFAYANDGSGNFTLTSQIGGFGNFDSFDVEFGDVDGDGDVDAYVANGSPQAENKLWLNRAPLPIALVTPATLTSTQAPNVTVPMMLNVANTGQAVTTLNWAIFEDATMPACDGIADISWITTIIPSSGSNIGGTDTDVTVTFDSTGLIAGSYTANLCVNTDDPTNPLIAVPLTLTVVGGNSAPVANDDSYGTTEDVVLNVAASGVLTNDMDIDGDPLTAVLDTDVMTGSLILNADGSFAYTPPVDWSGVVTFTYHANDGTADSNIATVTITVAPANDAPVANDDSYGTTEDVVLNVAASGVLTNDIDIDGDPLTAVLDTDVFTGSLILNADGSFAYTPPVDWSGVVTFTYHANDGTADSNIATVTITVAAANDAPVANDDSYGTTEDVTLNVAASGVLTNDIDIDGDPLTAVLDTDVFTGSLILNADGSFAYTPPVDWSGVVTFTYHANDGTADSNIATVTITVAAANDAPVANDDSYGTTEDVVLNVAASGVLTNDIDIDGDPLTAVLDTDVFTGSLILNADGSFAYTPPVDWSGVVTFTYHANDGTADSNIVTVTITVAAANDAPVANDDSYGTTEDVVLNVAASGVLTNDMDIDGDPLTAVLDTDVFTGSLILNADGSFAYTPPVDWSGVVTFSYHANDGTADSNIATVTITVTAANDAPVANDDSYGTTEDVVLNVAASGVLTNDIDIDGDPLTAVLDTDVFTGSLILNADGSFAYTPPVDWSGVVTFTYHANDGTADSNIATVTITVAAANDAPVANDDSYGTTEDVVLNVAASGVLTNDIDIDGDPLTAVLDTDVFTGSLILNADGSFAYTPPVDWSGVVTFSYHANDGTADSNIATVTITVAAANDAPVANDDSYGTTEDVVLNVAASGVLTNDMDIDGDPLTAVLDTDVFTGSLILNADGSFAYTPPVDWSGVVTFSYHANDGTADSNIATVTITVAAANDAPVANDDSYGTTEDVVLNVAASGVLTNDMDIDGDPLTAVLDTDVFTGSLILNADGSFAYTPPVDWSGVVTFTYHANDGTADSNIATVTITVAPANDAPVANDDSYGTTEDVVLNVAASGVLTNDIDIDGDPLTAVLDTDVFTGSLILNADGSFAYTPPVDWSGVVTFSYHANDGTADSNIATVTITVAAANDAPVANDDSYGTTEDVVLNVAASGVLTNDIDIDGDPLTAVLDTDVFTGSLILNADGSFAYTPPVDWSGVVTFTYHANDGTADSNIVTVTITVAPANDAPVANDDSYGTTEDVVLNVAASGVLTNDIDIDGDPLTAVLDTDVFTGSLILNADGSFSYTPPVDWSGVVTFSYHANDGTADSNIATVTITVAPDNDAPVANDDSYGTTEDVVLNVAASGVLTNDIDIDGDPLTAVLDTDVFTGSLILNADGSFAYTPPVDWSGVVTFTYHANDGAADSNIATVTITVAPANDAPVANDDSYGTTEDVVLNVAASGVLTNDIDIDGDPLTAVLDTDVMTGSLILNADGSFAYTPPVDWSGVVTFSYHANDGAADSNIATVTITVTAANDAPVANDDSYGTTEDVVLNVAASGVLTNDIDIDGDPLTAVLDTDVFTGSLILNADGSFAYTPPVDWSGVVTFSYHANDGTADSNIATVTITVAAANDAPVANDDSYGTTEDVVLNVAASGVLTNDMDIDGDPLTAVLDTDVFTGSLILNADGSFAYTPPVDWSGVVTFTYHANDGTADSNIATVTITVTAANDAPVANDDSYGTTEDVVLNVAASGVLTNDMDIDGDPLTAVLDTDVFTGSLILNADGSFAYTPPVDWSGVVTFSYHANDGAADSNIATVTITVAAANDAPIAMDDWYTATAGVTLTVGLPGVLGNDNDIDSGVLSSTVLVDVFTGTLMLNSDGSFDYLPPAGYSGVVTFTYSCSDGSLSDWATASITVSACIPPIVAVSTVSPTGAVNDLLLDWLATADAVSYEVWYSDMPYFTPIGDCGTPGPGLNCVAIGSLNWTHTNGYGFPASNNYYKIFGANACGIEPTATPDHVGEFDFTIVPGS